MLRLFQSKNNEKHANKAPETHKADLKGTGPPMKKSPSARSPGQHNSSPREVSKAKSQTNVVTFPPTYKTGIAVRLNEAAKRNPKTSGRSQDVLSLMKDCDRMCKNLHQLIEAARQYHQSLMDFEANRTALYNKTAILSADTHLNQVVAAEAPSIKGAMANLQDTLNSASRKHASSYQEMVLDYAIEWESVVCRMSESENSKTHQLHKVVQHYEDKVENLRNQMNDKESRGKLPTSGQTEKLQRNEGKLSEAWKDYDSAATRTANLLEEATQMGWKDLHPLIQAMINFERERDSDESKLWEYVGSLQDELLAVVAQHDEPLVDEDFEPSFLRFVPSKKDDEERVTDPYTPSASYEHMEPTERTEIHIDSSDEPDEPDEPETNPFEDVKIPADLEEYETKRFEEEKISEDAENVDEANEFEEEKTPEDADSTTCLPDSEC